MGTNKQDKLSLHQGESPSHATRIKSDTEGVLMQVVRNLFLLGGVIILLFGAATTANAAPSPTNLHSPQYYACNRDGVETNWWGQRIFFSSGTISWLDSTARLRDALYSIGKLPGWILLGVDWYMLERIRSNNRGCGVYIDANWAYNLIIPGSSILLGQVVPQ